MNLGHIRAERAQVEHLRKMHAVDAALGLRAKTSGLDMEDWVENIGMEALDLIVLEECAMHGVNVKDFEAWYQVLAEHEQAAYEMGAHEGVPVAEPTVGLSGSTLRSGPEDGTSPTIPNAQQDTATNTPEPTPEQMNTKIPVAVLKRQELRDKINARCERKEGDGTALFILRRSLRSIEPFIYPNTIGGDVALDVCAAIDELEERNYNDLLAALKALVQTIEYQAENNFLNENADEGEENDLTRARAAIKNATPTN